MKTIIEHSADDSATAINFKSDEFSTRIEMTFNEKGYSLKINGKIVGQGDKPYFAQKVNSIDRRLRKIEQELLDFDLADDDDSED